MEGGGRREVDECGGGRWKEGGGSGGKSLWGSGVQVMIAGAGLSVCADQVQPQGTS